MNKDHSLLSRTELEANLIRLKAELEDMEETVSFYFTHSAAHIKGGEAIRYEEDLRELKFEIAEIQRLLNTGSNTVV
jgi:hypothetical protein